MQVIATALQVICNCVTAPPSLVYLLPAPDNAGVAAAAAAAASAATAKPLEAHQTPSVEPTAAELTVSSGVAVAGTCSWQYTTHS